MRRLWIGLGFALLVSFSVLGWVGSRIYQMASPNLRRELAAVLGVWDLRDDGVAYHRARPERAAALRERLRREYQNNCYESSTNSIAVSTDRAHAQRGVSPLAAHVVAIARMTLRRA